MGLLREIGGGPVGVDTGIFIYLIERHSTFGKILDPLFRAIDRGRIKAVTSELTLLETLVVPYRAGDLELGRKYEEILTRSRNLELVPLDRTALRAAAALRAATSMKTPDALQIAAALSRRCTVFLTNDRDLPDLQGIRVLQLKDFE